MKNRHELNQQDIKRSKLNAEELDNVADSVSTRLQDIANQIKMSTNLEAELNQIAYPAARSKVQTTPKAADFRRPKYLIGIAASFSALALVLGLAARPSTDGEATANQPEVTLEANQPVATAPEVDGFTEDFATTNALNDSFDFDIFHANDQVTPQQNWQGDYASFGNNDECGGPETKRTISRGERNDNFNDEWIYQCVTQSGDGLLVTSIGEGSGYSIGAFSPKKSFATVKEIRWDLNLTDLGARQWTEVAVVGVGSFDLEAVPCTIEYLNCGQTHNDYNSVGVSFLGQQMTINTGNPETENATAAESWKLLYPSDAQPGGPASQTNNTTRRRHYLKQQVVDGQDVIVFGIEKPDGEYHEISAPGSFPEGEVRVIFSDHSLQPAKTESGLPGTFSWHWDNIEVES